MVGSDDPMLMVSSSSSGGEGNTWYDLECFTANITPPPLD